MSHQLITITETAASRLLALASKQPDKVLRLSVTPSGCSGHKYDLNYADQAGPNDERIDAHDASLFIDPLSVMFVAGMTIDWEEDKLERRFVFQNPNEAGRCGCGESFHT